MELTCSLDNLAANRILAFLRESINARTTANGVSIDAGMHYAKYLNPRLPFLILSQTALEEISEQAKLFFGRIT
jgi:hypothetical protein